MRAAAGVALVASLFSPLSNSVTNGSGAADTPAAKEFAARVAPINRSSELRDPASGRIASNDNRTAAGTFKNGALDLTLEIRTGMWFPESDKGASVAIQAFAEAGRAASVPGPLIRVPEGTEIRITLRNTLPDSAVLVRGLHTRPSSSRDEGVLVPARGSRTLKFTAGTPGTYYYWGTTSHNGMDQRSGVESQLSGGFIVDPRSGAARPDDRLFVIGMWLEPPTTINGVEKPLREVLVINGKSWPHTERFTFTEGDSVRWRWVNVSQSTHPMHLHGFYYSVNSRGAMSADTVFQPDARRIVNTELMQRGSTMATTWVPTQPGNWVFHCHFAFHVSGERVLEPEVKPVSNKESSSARAHHKPHAMAGLVLGITVQPRPGMQYSTSTEAPRNMRLLLQSTPRAFGDKPAFGFVLQDGAREPNRDSISMPGPMLLLKRGQPVRITVVNHLSEPSAVHWHGIELESFPDGVPNWSGMGTRIMQPIAPADSFVAEFTPPRSGTFIYHSHLNEGTQINSGMYGSLIVADDPRLFDSGREKVILVGGGGPPPTPDGDAPGFVNGTLEPEPLDLDVGTTYRFRLINIHPDWRVEFALGTDTTVAQWRPVAKDGADLPPAQTTPRAAYLITGPGETADFEYTPASVGDLRLQVRTRVSGWNIPVEIRVREPKREARAP